MKLAVSIGDPNGIGPAIALLGHEKLRAFCRPLYLVHPKLIQHAADLLGIKVPDDFDTHAPSCAPCPVTPGQISAEAGAYSFASFTQGVRLCQEGLADALLTLPIHKTAWQKAGIGYKGHTDALRDFFKQEAIMMLGCEKLFVGLFTEHIPLRHVPKAVEKERLVDFLKRFEEETKARKIGVLGLNPHAGDGGVLGSEERIIEAAIAEADGGRGVFEGPLVPDVAFTPAMRKRFTYYVAMYHDQGLAPLKALYFDESINVSLNLPILRVSVDHGTAFDIAYRADQTISLQSYLQAARYAAEKVSAKSGARR
ncbi:MAG: 4-hydroxythreonine-4-phosphate dehydrogenase [Epsilonproteobacteria bacterium]|nr:4-hydroxythreonine-4-phosphate dehydrogenase [Campylobacterota bacterium]